MIVKKPYGSIFFLFLAIFWGKALPGIHTVETESSYVECSLQTLTPKQKLELLVGPKASLPSSFMNFYTAVKITVLNDTPYAIRLDKRKYLHFFGEMDAIYLSKEDMLERYYSRSWDLILAATATFVAAGGSVFNAIGSVGMPQMLHNHLIALSAAWGAGALMLGSLTGYLYYVKQQVVLQRKKLQSYAYHQSNRIRYYSPHLSHFTVAAGEQFCDVFFIVHNSSHSVDLNHASLKLSYKVLGDPKEPEAEEMLTESTPEEIADEFDPEFV